MSEIKNSLLEAAMEFAEEKRYTECADAFVKIFEENPADPQALRDLATVMFSLGEGDSALSLLADSVDLENPDVPTLTRIGNLLLGLGRDSEAADFLLAALYRDPGNSELESETRALLERVERFAEFEEYVQAKAESQPAPLHSSPE